MKPGSCVGKYRLVRRLGLGAMGEVWEAENVDTDRAVALKLITSPDPELRRRLLREARAIGRLEHPNIVQILDRGETDTGEPFLVMQLLRGETLGDRLRRERTLSVTVAAGIALDVARALRVAHEKQIVHRDLKPANIFLHAELDTEEHIVKVVDFGVSKLSIDNEGGATMAGGLVGSPAYMSPEQIRATGVDGRTDIWAVGVLLYEMVAGERPFHAEQSVAVLTRILTTTAPRVEKVAPSVTPAFGNVIAACLERDPSKRVANAEELIRLLRPFAPRSRMATLQDATVVDRYAAIPEPPRSDAGPLPPSLIGGGPLTPSRVGGGPTPPPADSLEDRDSDAAATGVFQPGSQLSAMFGAPRAPTGTMLMANRPNTVQVPRPVPPATDTATGVYAPPSLERAVDDERPTAETLPRAPAQLAPTHPPPQVASQMALTRPPMASAPMSEPRAPMASAPSALISQPRAQAPATPAPSFDFGSGSWPEPALTSAVDEERAFGGTQPISAAVIAAIPPNPLKSTLKLDPNIIPPSPAAPTNAIHAAAITNATPAFPATAPLVIPATSPPSVSNPVFDVLEPPTRRGLPLVLLGVSALALAVVLTLLIMTLVDSGRTDSTADGGTDKTDAGTTPATSASPKR